MTAAILLALLTFSRPIAPTTYDTTLPSTAWSGDHFLTAWSETNETGAHIRGAFSDASGRRITPVSLLLVAKAYPQWLQVVATDDAFALFWRDSRQTLRMADVDANGIVSNIRTLDVPEHITARVGWNGSRFLVAIRSGVSPTYHAEALLLERDGTVVRRGLALDDRALHFDVVTSNGEFVVITSGFYSVEAYRIRAEGVEHVPIEAAIGLRGANAIAITAPDGTIVIVWSTGSLDTSELRAARLASDGSVSATRVLVSGPDVLTPLAVRRSGDGSVVAYEQQTPDLRRSALAMITLDATGARASDPRIGPEVNSITATAGEQVILAVAKLPAEPWLRGLPIGSDIAAEGESLALTPSRQAQAALAAGGGRFLAAWTQIGGLAAFTRAALLPSQQSSEVARGFVAAEDVVWNGAEFLVLHRDTTHLMASRLDANGERVNEQPILLAELRNVPWPTRVAAAVWTDTGWLVVWTQQGELRVTTISASGVAAEPRALTIDTTLPPEWSRTTLAPALAYDGANVLLAWHEEQSPICYFPVCSEGRSFHAAVRLSRTGEVLERPVELRAGTSWTDSLSVATSGREAVVLSGTTALKLEGPLGALHVADSRTLLDWLAQSDLTYDGREYVAAFRYFTGDRPYLALHRFDAQLRESAEPRGIATQQFGWARGLSVAAATSSGAAIAIDEADLDGSYVSVYREEELGPVPARRRTVRSR